MRFWDTSAIVPLLIADQQTDKVFALYRKNPNLFVWWGTSVECVSAIARLERNHELTSEAASSAINQLEQLALHWHEVQPVETIRITCQRLLRVHPLKAADSLQLAAALVVCNYQPKNWEFICFDDRLKLAALKEGFVIKPTES